MDRPVEEEDDDKQQESTSKWRKVYIGNGRKAQTDDNGKWTGNPNNHSKLIETDYVLRRIHRPPQHLLSLYPIHDQDDKNFTSTAIIIIIVLL